jgi:lipoprotein-anchoring transpeptidase ErfK/SrfK
MADTPLPPESSGPRKRRLASVGRIVLTCLVAVALLVALMLGTILRNDSPASSAGTHGFGASGPPAVQGTTPTPSSVAQVTTTTAKPLSPYAQAAADKAYLAVQSKVDKLEVCSEPKDDARVMWTYPLKNRYGEPSTFLATAEQKDAEGYTWYQVYVPEQPNESKGWVRASQVTPQELSHDVRVYLSAHRLDLYDYGKKVKSYTIGVGKGTTPSPLGEYFVVEKVVPLNTAGDYGVMAMGTSAFSETIQRWPGRPQVGIHGTNAPDTVGKDTTHGCIRLYNAEILELSKVVHLGTPVFINK